MATGSGPGKPILPLNPDEDYGVSSNLLEGRFGWHDHDADKINAANYFVATGVSLTDVYGNPRFSSDGSIHIGAIQAQ